MEDFKEKQGDECRLEKIMCGIAKTLKESLNESGRLERTVITKPKIPPAWNNETFERYKEQVDHWNSNSMDSDLNNYFDLIEVLKKKKDLKDCVINNVLDRTQREGKTVKKIMEVLGE